MAKARTSQTRSAEFGNFGVRLMKGDQYVMQLLYPIGPAGPSGTPQINLVAHKWTGGIDLCQAACMVGITVQACMWDDANHKWMEPMWINVRSTADRHTIMGHMRSLIDACRVGMSWATAVAKNYDDDGPPNRIVASARDDAAQIERAIADAERAMVVDGGRPVWS